MRVRREARMGTAAGVLGLAAALAVVGLGLAAVRVVEAYASSY